MSRSSIKELVFVLTSIPYRDSDLIVNFMTKENGKLSAVVYGGRKLNKSSSFHFQPGDLIELEYEKNESRDFIKILNTNGFKLLNTGEFSYDRFLFHIYLIEIISKISKPELSNSELYDLLNVNNQFHWNPINWLAFVVWILWKLIQTGGYQIDISVCSHCRKNTWRIKRDQSLSFRKQHYELDRETGGIICSDCNRGHASKYPITAAMIKVLWLCNRSEIFSSTLESIPFDVLGPLALLLNSYLLSCFEINPRSLDPFLQLISVKR